MTSTIETFELSLSERNLLVASINMACEFNECRSLAPEVIGQIAAQKMLANNMMTGLRRASVVPALRLENLPTVRGAYDAAILSATLGFIGEYGHPFQWSEQSSNIFQPVTPTPGAPPQSNGTNDRFDCHSDDAIIEKEFRPEILALIGVENHALAETGVVSAAEIEARLPRTLAEKARAPVFSIKAPNSFKLNNFIIGSRPILESHLTGVGIRMPTYSTFANDTNDLDAVAVVQTAKAIAEERLQWTLIEPGTALLVNNHLCLHARKPIIGHRLVVR
jgi:hypothetical protein